MSTQASEAASLSCGPGVVALGEASPSLALVKYWGKRPGGINLPATPSLAVTVDALKTTTRVRAAPDDELLIDGVAQEPKRAEPFFAEARRLLGFDLHFRAESSSSFPQAAGLASSSSGYAALALACVRLAASVAPDRASRLRAASLSLRELSALARIGSASASRALFGGFVLLPSGGRSARPIAPAEHWPELRVLVSVVSREAKELSSRAAMERTQATSPFYRAWVRSAPSELAESVAAVKSRDLERLGRAMRRSYLRMFATMLGCEPPLLYWAPSSLALIRECELLRSEGFGAWETMDAGPQVKVLCLEPELPRIRERLAALGVELIESRIGGAPAARVEED